MFKARGGFAAIRLVLISSGFFRPVDGENRRGFTTTIGGHYRSLDGQSRYLRFFCEILYCEARLTHHHGAPEDKASDAHRAGEEPQDSHEIEREAHGGSSKRGPDERDQRSRC